MSDPERDMSDLIEYAIRQGKSELKVDRQAGLVHGVKLLGPVSKNGNDYTKESLDDACQLYEGVDVYDGHHTRRYSDHVATVIKPYRSGDGVYGTLKLRPKHVLYEQVLDDAEHDPGNLALSHEVLDGNYEFTMVGNRRRIDRIHKVDAFAIVKQGGTNKSLVEELDVSKEIKNLEDLKTAYPDLFEEYRKGLEVEQRDSEKVARMVIERDKAVAERDELKKKLDLIEELKRVSELRQSILDEATGIGIDPKDLSDDLLEEFLGMKREMVSAFLKNMKPPEPVKKPESTSGNALADGDKPFYLRGK